MSFIKRFKYEILIVLLFILIRCFDLGHDMFNTDVWKWKSRSYDFSTGIFTGNFSLTNQKYHPGVTLMWLGTVGIKIFNLYNDLVLKVSSNDIQAVFGLHVVQKYLVVIAIGISLAFVFYALKKLFNIKYALLVIGLLSVEPFYVALTRVFHLEGLQSTFMFVSMLWFYYWFEKGRTDYKRLFITAFFSALAFLTKTSALYLIPFFGLWILLSIFNSKDLSKFKVVSIKKYVFHYFQWLLPTLMFVFLLWPALWVNPLEVFNTLYRGVAVVGVETEHVQYFFGKLVEDPGWYFYIIVFLLRSSWLLLIGFIFTLINYNKLIKGKSYEKFVSYTLLYISFYLIMLSIPSKKLDRYILPVIVSSILLLGISFEYYLNKFKSNFKYLIFLLPIVTLIYLHPNYLSYYSTGLKFGMYALEPKWMIGQKEIVKYLLDIKKQNNYIDLKDMSLEEVLYGKDSNHVLSVGFQEKYYTQIWPFMREINGWAVIKDLTPFAVKTNYFVYPIWEDDSYLEDRFKIKFIGTIKIRGTDAYNVYQRVGSEN